MVKIFVYGVFLWLLVGLPAVLTAEEISSNDIHTFQETGECITTTPLQTNFAQSVDCWTVTGDGMIEALDTIPGEPALCAADLGQGVDWYFEAPPHWTGDLSVYKGGVLLFRLSQDATDNQYDVADVIIISAQGTLTFATGIDPDVLPTQYEIPLRASAGWLLNGATTTDEQMQAALQQVTALRIRGEYRDGSDRGCLWMAQLRQANNTFDHDSQGWAVAGDSSLLEFMTETADGMICAADTLQGVDWYYQAPATWLGDLHTAYYGGSLTYTLRQDQTDAPYTAPDVIIESYEARLTYTGAIPPDTVFTTNTIPLTADAGWQSNGEAATPAQMEVILREVTALYIRGEYRDGADRSCLTEVYLSAAPPDTTAFEVERQPPAGIENPLTIDVSLGDGTVYTLTYPESWSPTVPLVDAAQVEGGGWYSAVTLGTSSDREIEPGEFLVDFGFHPRDTDLPATAMELVTLYFPPSPMGGGPTYAALALPYDGAMAGYIDPSGYNTIYIAVYYAPAHYLGIYIRTYDDPAVYLTTVIAMIEALQLK